MPFIKIAFCGAHGTGKTSAVRHLEVWARREFPQLRIVTVEEVARKSPWPVNEETTPQSQRWIYHSQMLAELEAEKHGDLIICDRSVLDNLAYASLAAYKSAAGSKRLTDEWSWLPTYLHAFRDSWGPTYQALWFMPADSQAEPLPDGFRSSSKEFQEDIDCMCRFLRSLLNPDTPHFDFVSLKAVQDHLRPMIKNIFNENPHPENKGGAL